MCKNVCNLLTYNDDNIGDIHICIASNINKNIHYMRSIAMCKGVHACEPLSPPTRTHVSDAKKKKKEKDGVDRKSNSLLSRLNYFLPLFFL